MVGDIFSTALSQVLAPPNFYLEITAMHGISRILTYSEPEAYSEP